MPRSRATLAGSAAPAARAERTRRGAGVALFTLWSAIAAVATSAVPGCRPPGSTSPVPGVPAPTRPSPGRPPVTVPASPAPPPAVRSWTFGYAPATLRYEVTSEATVELKADSGARSAPLRTVAVITLRLTPAADSQLTVDGSVDSYEVSRGGDIPPPDSAPPVSVVFHGTITPNGRVLSFRGASDTPCDRGEPLVAAARSLLVATPSAITLGATWSDSSSSTVCRDGAPVTTGVVREYEVEGRETVNGVDAVRVRRRETFTLAGASTVRGRVLTISGRGTSSSTLFFDPVRGVYLGGGGESVSSLTVSAGRTGTSFEQRVKQMVTLR